MMAVVKVNAVEGEGCFFAEESMSDREGDVVEMELCGVSRVGCDGWVDGA